MFGILGLGSAFINAAGRGGKKTEEYIIFKGSTADPSLWNFSGTGEVVIESIKSGQPVVQTFTNPDFEEAGIAIQADANTDIIIKGIVTVISFTDDAWTDLTYIDLTHAKSLERFDCVDCT